MKEITTDAIPSCFDKWCSNFDNLFKTKAQKRGFRNYTYGLMGDSGRKNLQQISDNYIDVSYSSLRRFLVLSKWDNSKINERRLELMSKCRQTKPSINFSLIIDDSGHKKSGNFTAGIGRQYIGEIGKTDNGLVIVTSHLYDGVRSLPLDFCLYQHANSLEGGKEDPDYKKKPEIAIELVDKCLSRKMKPDEIIIDCGYGNNSNFIKQLEERKLTYVAAIAKDRKIKVIKDNEEGLEIRLDEFIKTLTNEDFTPVILGGEKEKTVWVALFQAKVSKLEGIKTIAIVMNSESRETATEIDYLMTNTPVKKATKEWIVRKYSDRNWVEVFYREAKGWLGLKEYQVRDKQSLERHFTLVFCAYTFILWQKLTGGIARQWTTHRLKTFPEVLEAFKNAISFRFFCWLITHIDVFTSYRKGLGLIWT